MMNLSDLMLQEIMAFTETVVQIAEMHSVPNHIRARAILKAETILHQLVVNKVISKCSEASSPSCN